GAAPDTLVEGVPRHGRFTGTASDRDRPSCDRRHALGSFTKIERGSVGPVARSSVSRRRRRRYLRRWDRKTAWKLLLRRNVQKPIEKQSSQSHSTAATDRPTHCFRPICRPCPSSKGRICS